MIEKDIIYEDRKNFRGGGAYQGGSGAPGSAESSSSSSSSGNTGGNTGGGGGGNDRQLTGDDYRRAAREFQMGVQGAARNPIVGDTGPNLPFQSFQLNRPQVPNLPFGIGGMLMKMIPGSTSPLQQFSDFTTAGNRNFFINDVVRSGKVPGLDFGSISEMTEPELEQAYQSYMSNRLSGQTDAYGNPTQQSDNPLQNILLAQQQAAIANPLGTENLQGGVAGTENLQGGVAQLYNQYMKNIGSIV